MADNKNMELYEALCTPPNDATKPIDFGKLKGKRDINPQWRYEALTSQLGPCGIGWKYTVDNHWIQPVDKTGETMIFVMVTLYIKKDDTWSDGIPAYGGDFLIIKDKNGYHGNDEAMKMAITDALGTAMKMVGVAADVYRGLLDVDIPDTKYAKRSKQEQNAQNTPPQQVQKNWEHTNKGDTKKTKSEPDDAVRQQAMNRLGAVIKAKGLAEEYIVAMAKKMCGKTMPGIMTTEEIVKLAETLEAEQ